jgi:chromosome segregation ATPase
MVNKRQDLEKQLTKLSNAKDRISSQLEEAESKVKQLQSIVNSEMMETGTSSSLQTLSLEREKVTSLHQTLQFATGQVNAARQELEDYDRAARGGLIQELDKQLIQAVVDLQDGIGEAGLKGQLDKLGGMIAELEKLTSSGVMVHDVDQHLGASRNIYNDLSSSLYEIWKRIEGLKWGPTHNINPTEQGYLAGFGMLPGHLRGI